jgi:PTH1 family peptidyl-tRNA hydrolase
MHLVFCLGNPEEGYAHTRHNAAWLYARETYAINQFKLDPSLRSYILQEDNVLIGLPTTGMNASGEALKLLLKHYKPSKYTVLYDDIHLPLGSIRFRESGSAGGHNGIKSIISTINSEAFRRLKIGIGPKPSTLSLIDYVLSDFTASELVLLRSTFGDIKDKLLV